MIRALLVRGAVVCGIAALLLMGCPALQRQAVAAGSCSLSGATLTFGTINIFSGSTTSGNATLTCNTAGRPLTFYACLSIGTGTGGTTPGNRTLASGSSKLPIQITGGASWPSDIGNGTSFPMEGVISFTVPRQSSGTYTFPVVVTIPTPPPLPAPGTYSSNFTGTDFQVYWDTASQSTCAALASAGGTKTTGATLSVSAAVANQCSAAATSLNFGTASVLTSTLNAIAQITVTCNGAIPLTIALDNGATGTGPTSRLMTSGTHSVQYGIYQDNAHSQPWGSTVGVNTETATGPTATVTAYGSVPAQSAPVPGAYADIVGVTVTY